MPTPTPALPNPNYNSSWTNCCDDLKDNWVSEKQVISNMVVMMGVGAVAGASTVGALFGILALQREKSLVPGGGLFFLSVCAGGSTFALSVSKAITAPWAPSTMSSRPDPTYVSGTLARTTLTTASTSCSRCHTGRHASGHIRRKVLAAPTMAGISDRPTEIPLAVSGDRPGRCQYGSPASCPDGKPRPWLHESVPAVHRAYREPIPVAPNLGYRQAGQCDGG